MLEIPVTFFKERDKSLLNFYSSVIAKNDTVIDVGANIGVHTTKFLKLVGSRGHVVAIEPIKRLAEDLTKYKFLHGPKLTIVNAVAGATMETVEFIEHESTPGSHVKNFGYTNAIGKTIYIESITIDSLNLSPKFIKIDTEGYERNVILGCMQTIKEHRPHFAIETDISNRNFLVNFFRSQNYSIIDEAGFDLYVIPN